MVSEKRATLRVTLTRPYLEAVDRLIREGLYVSRVEVVKDALRRLFRHYGIEVGREGGEAPPPVA